MIGARVRQFWNLPRSFKLAGLEAILFLVFAQLLIKLVPYRWWSYLLGPIGTTRAEIPCPVEDNAVELVGWAVHTGARYLPWDVVCLPRAMVGKWMLARRNVVSTMFLGIQRRVTDGAKATDLHAWLQVGDQTISGGEVARQFTVIARYGA